MGDLFTGGLLEVWKIGRRTKGSLGGAGKAGPPPTAGVLTAGLFPTSSTARPSKESKTMESARWTRLIVKSLAHGEAEVVKPCHRTPPSGDGGPKHWSAGCAIAMASPLFWPARTDPPVRSNEQKPT